MLFEPDNVDDLARCMYQMAAHTKRRRRMGRNAMLTALGFAMPTVVDQLEALYQRTIQQDRKNSTITKTKK
jgi:hypothetical protein